MKEFGMKKLVFMAAVVLVAAAAAFGVENYTVQSVTGRVEREAKSGVWETVKAGDVLTGEMVLRTGIGASVTVLAEENTSVIGAAKNDTLAVLISGAKNNTVRISGQISKTDTGAADRNTGRIGTASARASDAAGELPIDEE
jgi:hypothetical protein